MHDQLPGHLLSVYRFAMHLCGDQHLAEDLTQEAMLRALRNLHALRDSDLMRVWLFRIVKNLWTDRYRSNESMPVVALNEYEPSGGEVDPSESVEMCEEIALTLEAMQQLPERQRAVLHLIACQQCSVVEVANVLEISSAAVRSSLSLARAQMRKSIVPKNITANKNLQED